MKLTKNFDLGEFLISQTAERHGIDMTPPRYVIDNLKSLCVHVLQPIRDAAQAPISISSGYRPLDLNSLIGGSKTSAHMQGEAADFNVAGLTPYETCELVIRLKLPFDQVIHEFGRWVHVGIRQVPRGEVLTAYRDKAGATRYIKGLHEMETLA